ncbi:hypothetical protein K1719_029440 [Acacia pycnantha]|nr:hypothetical protein K1719_029440 [Acacia pycnantha]
MGEFRGINKYGVVFLALLACHEVVLTHGRLQVKAHRPTAPGNSPGVGHLHKHMTDHEDKGGGSPSSVFGDGGDNSGTPK